MPKFLAGADDAEGDLAAIGDEDFLDHRGSIRVPEGRRRFPPEQTGGRQAAKPLRSVSLV
jgi:hypothetical protein